MPSVGRAIQSQNKVRTEDLAAHDWYRFVLSFPPHLVRDYAERFSAERVLDLFCGTGTTLVECKKLGIDSVGIDANPMACFASRVKVDWNVDPDGLVEHAGHIAEIARKQLWNDGIDSENDGPLFQSITSVPAKLHSLAPEAWKLLLKNSISPLPLHKTLVLLEAMERVRDSRFDRHERLALAKAVVFRISNLHFGPEVGVVPPKAEVPVINAWLDGVQRIASDIRRLKGNDLATAVVHQADARSPLTALERDSVDAVITSPPYPNEKDYTRTTRLESVLLGFISNKEALRTLKWGMIRSNTRGVYKGDTDDSFVAEHQEIQRIAGAIESRRHELGKTSGFERLYHRVTKLYFGGMARHLSELRAVLRPGARLAYVVGDQASYLRVMIRTGQLLADIAQSLGYELIDVELFRTRMATATGEQLREEVVLLRWPGGSGV